MCYLMFNQNNCRWRDMDNKQMCDEIQSDFNKQICEVIMHLYYTEVRLIILRFFKLNAAYRICLQKVYNLYWIAKAVTSKQTLMIHEVKNNKSKSIKGPACIVIFIKFASMAGKVVVLHFCFKRVTDNYTQIERCPDVN